jgi:hypothetical protein
MRFVVHIFCTVSVCLSLCASTIDSSSLSSPTFVITFDDLAGGNCTLCGTPVTNQYAAVGVKFNNPSYPGQDTADTNLTYGIPNASFGNALYVAQGGHMYDPPGQPFQILFSVPVWKVGFDYASSTDSFLRVDAYDSHNTLMESLIYAGGPTPIGLGGFAGLQESIAIGRLDVSYHPYSDPQRTFNFSIDNLEFESAVAVPEPSTFGLIATAMLAGFLGRRWRWAFGRPFRQSL